MTILGLFTRKSANRSERNNPRGNQSSSRDRRGSYYATATLMDSVGRLEVSE